jgi:putative addiction module component (TIGR02574 family)
LGLAACQRFSGLAKTGTSGQTWRMARPALDISSLSPEERLELIGELWDSLEHEHVPLTPEQKSELNRRLDVLEQAGPRGSAWDDVEARIRARR